MNNFLHQTDYPTLRPLGDAAWTVEFGRTMDDRVHGRVLGFVARLEALARAGEIAGVLEWVPAFRSVTVHFDPDRIAGEVLAARLLAVAEEGAGLAPRGRRWRLPVCFDPDLGPDLEDVARAKGLEVGEVVALMTAREFPVLMLGFLPGFPYLGGLPEILSMPRLANPRKAVPAGSLAIAGGSCAVYPWESPGGWRLLGRTPIPLFDPARAGAPALLAAGDRVGWQAVAREEYETLAARCRRGELNLDSFLAPGEGP